MLFRPVGTTGLDPEQDPQQALVDPALPPERSACQTSVAVGIETTAVLLLLLLLAVHTCTLPLLHTLAQQHQ